MDRWSPGPYSHTSSLQPPIKLHVRKLHRHNKMELEILPRRRVATCDDVGTPNQSGTSIYTCFSSPESESNPLSTRFPPRTRRNEDGDGDNDGDREPTPVARPSSAFSCCSTSPPNNHALVSPIPEFGTTRFPFYFQVLHLLWTRFSKTPRADRPANPVNPYTRAPRSHPPKTVPHKFSLSISLHPQTRHKHHHHHHQQQQQHSPQLPAVVLNLCNLLLLPLLTSATSSSSLP